MCGYKGPVNYIPALVQIKAWCRPGDKPLSEAMMVSLLTHICVTRLQWDNPINGRMRHPGQRRGPMLRCADALWIEVWTYVNYANPVYGVAIICHQVRWLRWGHPNLFHIATFLLIWYKMFCVRDISYRLIWMEFINMFSVYAQSGAHSRFNL